MPIMIFFGAIGLMAAGALLGRKMWRDGEVEAAPPVGPPVGDVRDAGPEHMLDPPTRWDMVDQQADESFPASDPPGNY